VSVGEGEKAVHAGSVYSNQFIGVNCLMDLPLRVVVLLSSGGTTIL